MPLWLEISLAVLGLVTAGASACAAWLAWSISCRAFAWEKRKIGPEIRVTMHLDEDAVTFIYLVIENIGQSAAYDIRFELSEKIPIRAFGFIQGETEEERRICKERLRSTSSEMTSGPLINGIPAMAAGDRRVILWGQYGGLRSWLDDRFVQVKAEYKDSNKQSYNSLSILEVESYETSDISDNRPERSIAKSLEEISMHLKRCVS